MTYEEIMKDYYESRQRHAELELKWKSDQDKIDAAYALLQMHISIMCGMMYYRG